MKLVKYLSNPQILSALIWAAVILLCAAVEDKTNIFLILITAAGLHASLMNNFAKETCPD